VLRTVNNGGAPHSLAFDILSPSGAALVCGSCREDLAPFAERRHSFVLILPAETRSGTLIRVRLAGSEDVVDLPFLAAGAGN
jgi:hypothetical protein